jgi:hypothetical protein
MIGILDASMSGNNQKAAANAVCRKDAGAPPFYAAAAPMGREIPGCVDHYRKRARADGDISAQDAKGERKQGKV